MAGGYFSIALCLSRFSTFFQKPTPHKTNGHTAPNGEAKIAKIPKTMGATGTRLGDASGIANSPSFLTKATKVTDNTNTAEYMSLDRHNNLQSYSSIPTAIPSNSTDLATNLPNSPKLRPSQKTSKGNTLEADLVKCRVEWPKDGNRFFIPIDAFKRIITEKAILEEFQRCGLAFPTDVERQDIARRVLERAPKLFTTLVLLGLSQSIIEFLQDDIDDKHLPFVRQDLDDGSGGFRLCSKLSKNSPIKCMLSWERREIESFIDGQWSLESPFFEKKEEVSHYELDDKCVLPFIKDDELNDKAIEGGFSSVWEILIHPAHHNLFTSTNPRGVNLPIALKRLHSANNGEFKSEVQMFQFFSKSTHPHLIKLLATFRYKRRYYLLFPYAKSNLRKYWEETPVPDFSEATVLWFLRQCQAIASGLHRIHEYNSTRDDSSKTDPIDHEAEHLYGRHGDLKPENILWSVERRPDKNGHINEQGLLLIADFGLMDFHTVFSRSRIIGDNIHGSPTYAPPERRLNRNSSRAYDIWSLGCVYLEFVTWLVCGWEDLNRFSPARAITGPVPGLGYSNKINDDTFYFLISDGPGKPYRPEVRESVREWMNDLHEKPRCSAFIHEFLSFISESMLKVEPSERAKCGELNTKLCEMLTKAKSRPSYLVNSIPSSPRSPRPDPFAFGDVSRPFTTQSLSLTDGTPLPKCPFVDADPDAMRPLSPVIRSSIL